MAKRKTYIAVFLLLFFILNLSLTPIINIVYATSGTNNESDVDEEKPNILIRVLTSGFRWVTKLVYDMLDDDGLSLDALVFNQGTQFSGLTLFKPGEAQNFLATFYNIFMYIAMLFFVPIFFWVGTYFSKAGDSPQQKSVLKDKLMRVLLTFVFLYSMPELLTILVKVSNAFVGVFKSVGSSFLETNTNELVGEYIKTNKGSITETFTGLMLIGVNIWIIIYYIIRDLTVCFLFMFFPLIAIWYPMDTSMIKNWWREMMGNIFAQPIQAVILTMVLALGKTLGVSAETNTLANRLYTLVAFGSIIPMTSIIKRFFNLETGIGAGKSMAGLGALTGAFMLAKSTSKGMKQQTDKIREGVDTLSENNIAQKQLDKNLSPTTGMGSVDKSLTNTNTATMNRINQMGVTNQSKQEMKESIHTQNRVAKKQIAQGIGGATLGTYAGIGSAVAMSSVGGREAMMAGGAGFALGRKAGDVATGVGYSGINAINEDGYMDNDIRDLQIQEIMDRDGINDKEEAIEKLNEQPDLYKNEAMNKYLGLDNEKLNGTEFQAKERQALMKQKRWQAKGTGKFANYMANKSYAELTPTRKSFDELKEIDNAYLYQDKEHSVVYTQNSDGQVAEILSVGAGNTNLSSPIDTPVAFNTEQIEIPQSKMHEFNSLATSEAKEYMDTYYSEYAPQSMEYKQAFSEREKYYKQNLIEDYRNQVNLSRQNTGIPIMNLKSNDEEYIFKQKQREQTESIDRAMREKQKEQIEKLNKMREEINNRVYQEDFKTRENLNGNLDELF